MKKLLVAGLFTVLAIPSMAVAQQNNVGSCGWGSRLFHGQKGVLPQVLAVTTNGTSNNQTFAITSGTSGCTSDGVVTSSWKTAMFIDSNLNKLAQNMSNGHGEALDTLASLLAVESSDRGEFNRVAQASFSNIFTSKDVTSNEVVSNLRSVLQQNARLDRYSANI
jgi:hypothetical protein